MIPFFRHVVVGTLTSAALFVGASGCTDAANDVYIVSVMANSTAGTSGGCGTLTADPSQPMLFGGTLDLVFANQYVAHVLVGSQILGRASKTPLRAESSVVQLQGTEVSIEDNKGTTIAGPYTVPGSGFIKEAQASSATYGAIETILVDAATAKSIKAQLVAKGNSLTRVTTHVKAFGQTIAGTSVETSDYSFPVDICIGCLVTFPLEADDTNLPTQPNCAATSGTVTGNTSCLLGQDNPIDCRICHILHPGDTACDPPQAKVVSTGDGGTSP